MRDHKSGISCLILTQFAFSSLSGNIHLKIQGRKSFGARKDRFNPNHSVESEIASLAITKRPRIKQQGVHHEALQQSHPRLSYGRLSLTLSGVDESERNHPKAGKKKPQFFVCFAALDRISPNSSIDESSSIQQ
jgi:hypothetical protein